MRSDEALGALERAGTAQNRKVYARHGVKGPCYGVSFAERCRLAKAHGRDQALAGSLWASGVTPAVLPYLERAWARKRGKATG
jgi:hypothetical protein